ncbi:hypothetical protein [Pseudomonas syringae]|uniref:hypothetical protein n=1 Tax=Pseudomonas syringae TaxID=317 RepID=UPI001784F19F|nr:hypothetical protein [Pseudomonas syringae]
MMTTELSAIQRNEVESARLAEAMAEFESRGGRIAVVSGYRPTPPPRRKDYVDPETVLKRRPARITPAEQVTLRKLASSV